MLACWGNNSYSQTTVPRALRTAHKVSTSYHTCALVHMQGKSRIGCWGDDSHGQVTIPQYIWGLEEDSGVTRESRTEIVTLGCGNDMSAGVDREGELHMWGKKEYMAIPEK